jgi:hypothetical protein
LTVRDSSAGLTPATRRLATWSVDGARHKVHRVIYALTYGVWPTGEVDHIDGDRRNNDPANLRVATRSQNMQNRKGAGSLSALGLMGVSSAAKQNCPGYKYTITVNGKRTVKYGFATPEEAHAAYLAAKREVHPFAQAVFK